VTALLSVRGVSANYGAVQALREISLEVNRGEIVTLIGANGAGKSTTLMCLSRVTAIAAGEIIFDGVRLNDMRPNRVVGLGLAQVPEGRRIFPRLSVLENLQMGAYLRSDRDGIAKDLAHVYELFPVLRERTKQAGGTLSGGEQQMLAIGRAIMSRPRLLMMDEPSMGIAPILVARIFEAVKRLKSEGMTILLVEQNARAALKLADRGYVIETGRIVLADRAAALLVDRRVQESYLGE